MEKSEIDLLQNGYGLTPRVMNEYQIRLSNEEFGNVFFDWYHTTGSLVAVVNGKQRKLQKEKDLESMAINVQRYLRALKTRSCPCCGQTVTNE